MIIGKHCSNGGSDSKNSSSSKLPQDGHLNPNPKRKRGFGEACENLREHIARQQLLLAGVSGCASTVGRQILPKTPAGADSL
jgi:hypothetical protein